MNNNLIKLDPDQNESKKRKPENASSNAASPPKKTSGGGSSVAADAWLYVPDAGENTDAIKKKEFDEALYLKPCRPSEFKLNIEPGFSMENFCDERRFLMETNKVNKEFIEKNFRGQLLLEYLELLKKDSAGEKLTYEEQNKKYAAIYLRKHGVTNEVLKVIDQDHPFPIWVDKLPESEKEFLPANGFKLLDHEDEDKRRYASDPIENMVFFVKHVDVKLLDATKNLYHFKCPTVFCQLVFERYQNSFYLTKKPEDFVSGPLFFKTNGLKIYHDKNPQRLGVKCYFKSTLGFPKE